MTRGKLTEIEVANRRAARIILSDPERHAGLPLIWAQLWASRHRIGPGPEDAEKSEPTFEEQMEAAVEKVRVKAIRHRRERWKQRQWRWSRRGNLFVNVNGFHIVVFPQCGKYSIRIMNRLSDESHYSRKSYATPEEAMAGAFDALLYMESKRVLTHSQFQVKGNYDKPNAA
jgi:hypothetical protein